MLSHQEPEFQPAFSSPANGWQKRKKVAGARGGNAAAHDAAFPRRIFLPSFFSCALAFITSGFFIAATARGGAVSFSTRRKKPKTRGGPRPLDPRGCSAFPSPLSFPSALGRLAPLGSLNAGPFTGTLAILRLRKFLRIFGVRLTGSWWAVPTRAAKPGGRGVQT